MRHLTALSAMATVVAASAGSVGAAHASPGPAAGTDVPISDTRLHSYQQPTVAVDPTDAGHLAVSFQDGLQTPPCYLAQSFDGGSSWSMVQVAGPGGKVAIPTGYDTCRNQVIAFGPSGILYYVIQVSSSTHFNASEIVATATTDRGATFSAPTMISTADSTDSTDIGTFQPSAAVDPVSGRLYVTWLHYRQFSTYTYVQVSSSGDGGRSFSSPVQLSPVDPNQNQQTGSTVVGVDASGQVFVAWIDATTWRAAKGQYGIDPCPPYPAGCPPFELLMRVSRDQGQTFSPAITVDSGIESGQNDPWRFSHLVSMSVADDIGKVSLAWTEPRNGLNRVVFTRSADSGHSWSAPAVVSPPPGLDNHEQDRALVSTAPGGRIDVAFYDLGPVANGTRLQNVYERSSADDGVTFTAPVLLTSAASDTTVGPPNPGTDLARMAWFGRNFGLASTNERSFVAWTDSRRGNPNNAKQDIFFEGLSPAQGGYWLVAGDGGIFPFGDAGGYGSTGGIHLNRPVVGMAPTPTGHGYWLVASDGGIFPFGDAGGYGSTGGVRLTKPVVGMAPTPTGHGYWLVASDGGIFPFGDAAGYGSTGAIRLNKPVVGMAATPTGHGYWLVASDGGIFPFGDASGHGSTGAIQLNKPVVGMAATPTGHGYWLVASDGGIFPFGDAGGHGSTGAIRLNRPVVGMAAMPTGGGYWLVASDGGIFPFGDAPGLGSTGGTRLNQAVVGMGATP